MKIPSRLHEVRYCTGGCANGPHRAHLYDVDPVDGPLHRTFLCPGNHPAETVFDVMRNGEWSGRGFVLEWGDQQIPQIRETADRHPFYNFDNFPVYLGQNCRNWEIRTNLEGTHCAALAVEPGCESTHYGSITYARAMLGHDMTPEARTRHAAAHQPRATA